MTDDIVTRLRKHHEWFGNGGQPTSVWEDAADEIERLKTELRRWATTPPNRMACVTHGEMFMCFDEHMGGVYWCEGCRND